MVYVDTSVLVAYYCPEPLSEIAEKVVRQSKFPAISSLVELEMCSALAMKIRTGEMDASAASAVLAKFNVHRSEGHFRIVEIGAKEYGLARDWLGRFSSSLRTLDALHLAAAFANGIKMITADKSLAESARHFGAPFTLIS